LIDNISSKIVALQKGVVIYGANALPLLPVVLFNVIYQCSCVMDENGAKQAQFPCNGITDPLFK